MYILQTTCCFQLCEG